MGSQYQIHGKWITKCGQEIDFLQYKSPDQTAQPDISKIYLHGEKLQSMGYNFTKNKIFINPFYKLIDFLIKYPTSSIAVDIFSGFFENVTENGTVEIGEENFGSEAIEGNSKIIEAWNTLKKSSLPSVKHLDDDDDIKIEVNPEDTLLYDDNFQYGDDNINHDYNLQKYNQNIPIKVHTKGKSLSEKVFKCKVCNEVFLNKNELLTHVYTIHGADIAEDCICSHCGLMYQCKKNKVKHVKNNHDPNRSQMGPKKGPSITKIKRDILIEKEFKCKVCLCKIFLNKEELKMHVLEIHGPDMSEDCICCQCGLMFQCKKNKVKHEKKFHGIMKEKTKSSNAREMPNNGNICPTCGVVLSNRWTLENHLKVVHENKFDEPKRCAFYNQSSNHKCKKKFLTPFALEQHTNFYHKDGPESATAFCQYCSEEFKGAKGYVTNRLKIHIEKVHLGIRHTCEECNKVFMSIKILAAHKKHVHRQEGHHPCKECGKVFKYYSAAQEHAFLDRGETPYECKNCDFKSAHSWALAKHRPVCKFLSI